MNWRNRRGFTLIELLVVVAIIAVLIAILLPSLGRAKANAVRVKCAAVLKQWGNVIQMYAQENDNLFGIEWSYYTIPPNGGTHVKVDWASLSAGAQTIYDPEWSADAASTGKKTSISFRTCPGDPSFGQLWAAGSGYASVWGNSNVSARPQIDYAMVRYLPVIPNGPLMWRMTNMTHPSSTVLMCDSPPTLSQSQHDFWTFGQLDGDSTATDPTKSLQLALNNRHMGTGNVLFIDGHVEQHTYDDYKANIPAMTNPDFTLPASEAGKVWTSF